MSTSGGTSDEDQGEQIAPDLLYVEILGLLEAQGSKVVEPLLREHHHARGNRLFALMTLIVVLPGFDQVLLQCSQLNAYFDGTKQLKLIAFLVRRAQADIEIAIEALLVGRQALVSDAMRDVMEIEMLLRDFAARPSSIADWVSADERTLRNRFSPKEIRRRLANDLYPGKGFDLPEADEYAVHSSVLHPSPHGNAHQEKQRDATMHDGRVLFESGEVLEHAIRLFVACDALIDAMGPTSAGRPPTHRDLDLLTRARDEWRNYTLQLKDQIGMPPRGPRPRGSRNPLLQSPAASDPDH